MASGRRSQDKNLETLDNEVGLIQVKMNGMDGELKTMKNEIDQNILSLSAAVTSLGKQMSDIAQKIDVIWDSSNKPGGSTSGGQQLIQPRSLNVLPRTTKLDFPKFQGEEPHNWIYRAEQYFQLNQIPEDQKVMLASFHLEHEAIQWYQWYEKNIGVPNWEEFCKQLLTRFGPTTFEDFTGELTKLRQTRLVLEYQSEFERLANRTQGLNKNFFISCFISGLKEELAAEVKMFSPTSMKTTIGLARLAEKRIEAQKRVARPVFKSQPFSRLATNSNSKPWQVKRLTQKRCRNEGNKDSVIIVMKNED